LGEHQRNRFGSGSGILSMSWPVNTAASISCQILILRVRLPPPPPKSANSLENLRVFTCRSRRLQYFSICAPERGPIDTAPVGESIDFPSNFDNEWLTACLLERRSLGEFPPPPMSLRTGLMTEIPNFWIAPWMEVRPRSVRIDISRNNARTGSNS